ncbi:hypothetical protein AVEN_144832-1 [Araneus ventricosus]|uniref:Uncharacterized protein n=1 Tax=Araneus ventricosus TaxID=182803 RepID=A0A4Y2XBB9_ARAVE|nr:hypothetical protein AVEN_144832-1 [Araneus ventricosus]
MHEIKVNETHSCLRRHGQEDIRVTTDRRFLDLAILCAPPEHSSQLCFIRLESNSNCRGGNPAGVSSPRTCLPKPHVQCLEIWGDWDLSKKKEKLLQSQIFRDEGYELDSQPRVVIYLHPCYNLPLSGARKWAVVGEDNTAHYPLVIQKLASCH